MSLTVSEALRKLGLTGYETKVYMALLKYGSLTAYEISSLTGVPYPKVYSSVNRLEDLGLVRSLESRPLRFKVEPPSMSLEKLKNQIVEELEDSVGFLVKELSPLYSAVSKMERYGRLNIVGLSRVVRGVLKLVSEAAEELLMILPSKKPVPVARILKKVAAAARRGVRVKLLAQQDAEKLVEGLDIEFKVIRSEKSVPILVVTDKKVSLLATRFIMEDGFEHWSGVISVCENCVKNARDVFQKLWEGGQVSVEFEKKCLTKEELDALAKYLKKWPSLRALGLKT